MYYIQIKAKQPFITVTKECGSLNDSRLIVSVLSVLGAAHYLSVRGAAKK